MVFNAAEAVHYDWLRYHLGIDVDEEAIVKEKYGIDLKIKVTRDRNSVPYANFIFTNRQDLNFYKVLGRINESMFILYKVRRKWL